MAQFTGKAEMQAQWPEAVFQAASVGDYLDDEMTFDTALRHWGGRSRIPGRRR